MGSVSNKTETSGHKRVKTPGPFKGVRMRTWGTWVSEIRRPLSKERIWLGSFDAPEKAARAYDAALYCLQGPKGKFNFPDDERPKVSHSSSISSTVIKAVAASFAAPKCTSPECKSPKCISARISASPLPTMDPPEVPPSPTMDPPEVPPSPPTMNPPETPSFPSISPSEVSPFPTTNPGEVVVVDRDVKPEIKSEGCDSIFGAGSEEHDAISSESFLLDEAFTFDPDTIWAILEETKEFTEAKLIQDCSMWAGVCFDGHVTDDSDFFFNISQLVEDSDWKADSVSRLVEYMLMSEFVVVTSP